MKSRSSREELLDGPIDDPQEFARSLVQVAQVNRWLGGNRGLRRCLSPLLQAGGRVSILDVGTGNGETLQETLRWARARGGRWMGAGVDLGPHAAVLARRRGLPVAIADARTLPFPDGAFDVVSCTLTLHHFDDSGARALVREMARVARRLVLVSDLERSGAHYLGARALGATLWRRNRFTRHDGPLSVLRSFTAGELLSVGREAGLKEPGVRRFFPWRLVLSGEP
jgi:SAM-dependent methyltransferase